MALPDRAACCEATTITGPPYGSPARRAGIAGSRLAAVKTLIVGHGGNARARSAAAMAPASELHVFVGHENPLYRQPTRRPPAAATLSASRRHQPRRSPQAPPSRAYRSTLARWSAPMNCLRPASLVDVLLAQGTRRPAGSHVRPGAEIEWEQDVRLYRCARRAPPPTPQTHAARGPRQALRSE